VSADAEAEPEVSDVAPPAQRRPQRELPSLFDDAQFSLDTPGVLDRVFDEHESTEETIATEPAGFEEREAFADEDETELAAESETEEDEDAAEGAVVSTEEETESEEEEPRRRRRRRRRRRSGKKDSDGTAADEDADSEAAGEAEEDDSDAHAEDKEEEPSTLGVKHRKIPTWQEAVDVVIAANLESRSRNPSGGSRGRRRGRGRRS
jgi:hypothetical protein